MYFVFSNVIETSSTLDLKILQDLLRHLTASAQKLNTFMETHRLCNAFIELYEGFTKKLRSNPSNPRPSGDFSVHDRDGDTHTQHHSRRQINTSLPVTPMTAHSSLDRNLPVDLTTSTILEQQPCDFVPESLDTFVFDQQVDWELFYQQPEVDMFFEELNHMPLHSA